LIFAGNGLKRRSYGSLYWLPDVVALFLLVYAAMAIFPYCKGGDLKGLAFGSAVLSLAAMILTIEIRSYAVATFHLSLSVLNVAANVHSHRAWWPGVALVT
jgi:hypothetical protein